MESVLATLVSLKDHHQLNRERWRELESDPALARLDQRIETDKYGKIVMMPPPGFEHSCKQGAILRLLEAHMPEGKGLALPECPISTTSGVKGVDAAWLSHERAKSAVADNLLITAPEICIEVISPGNTRQEIEDKKRLYFESGAEEVWICGLDGTMAFFVKEKPEFEASLSSLCPDFPQSV
ncbi:MAG: Uma2 family endonuclease [Verrucomicrobiota bacterium]